jgi:hypothetical protein
MTTKTLVGYPDEPSRRAMIIATAIVAGAGIYGARKLRDPMARAAVGVGVAALTVPLALLLTRLGF